MTFTYLLAFIALAMMIAVVHVMYGNRVIHKTEEISDLHDIIVLGVKLRYKCTHDWAYDEDPFDITEFYFNETETVSERMFLFFGPTIIRTRPKYAFSVGFHITSPKYTKAAVRNKVEAEFRKNHGDPDRMKELERGEII